MIQALQYARRALQTADAFHDDPDIATCRNDVGKATGRDG